MTIYRMREAYPELEAMIQQAEKQTDGLPYGVIADWIDERGEPNLASIIRLLATDEAGLLIGARAYAARTVPIPNGQIFAADRLSMETLGAGRNHHYAFRYRMKWVEGFGDWTHAHSLQEFCDEIMKLQAEEIEKQKKKASDMTKAEFAAELKKAGIADQTDVFPGFYLIKRGGRLIWRKPKRSLTRREKLAALKR